MSQYKGTANETTILTEDWGAEEAQWSGKQVQDGIKAGFKSKVGYHSLEGRNLMGFANEESYNKWKLDPTQNQSLVLSNIKLDVNELADVYNIKLLGYLNNTSIDSNDSINISPNNCQLTGFGFQVTDRDSGQNISENTPILYSIKVGDSVVISGSTFNNTTLSTPVDLKNYISKTYNYLTINVKIGNNYSKDIIVSYNLNDLYITFRNETFWENPITYQNEGTIEFYLDGTINSGQVGNIYVLLKKDNVTYQIKSNNIDYISKDQSTQVQLSGGISGDAFSEGNYVLEAYLQVGNNKSESIYKNVLIVRSDSTAKYICANLDRYIFNNYTQSDICKFFVVNGNNIEIQQIVKVQSQDIVNIKNIISSSNINLVSGVFNVDAAEPSLSGNIELILCDQEGNPTDVKFSQEFTVTNSSPFKQQGYPTIVIDPINQLSGNQSSIKNSATLTRTDLKTVWNNMIWSKNDGWISGTNDLNAKDYERLSCLKILRDSSVEIEENFINTGPFTLEIYYKTFNALSEDSRVISCLDQNNNGLSITKGSIIFNPSGAISEKRNYLIHNSDNITHLTIVYNDNLNQKNIPITKLYLNGKIAREIDGKISSTQINKLIIGSSGADIAIYKVRKYNTNLSDLQVFYNYLNCIYINDSYRIAINSKNAEIFRDQKIVPTNLQNYNYFILKYTGEGAYKDPLPGYNNREKINNISVEFHWDKSMFSGNEDITINNCTIEGQGSSSKSYYRWNWRVKDVGEPIIIKTKDGGYGISVKRITAKKNTASSMHSHKMGFINSYQEIYEHLSSKSNVNVKDSEVGYNMTLDYQNLKSELLKSNSKDSDTNHRVSMWQAPFFGFVQNSDRGYDFVGLYTLGPDKADKLVSGFDTKTYTDLFEMEGAEQAPKLQNFAEPWEENEFTCDEEGMVRTTYNNADGFEIINSNKDETKIESFVKNVNETYRCIVDHSINIQHCESYNELSKITDVGENSFYWLHDDTENKHKLYWRTDDGTRWLPVKHSSTTNRETQYWDQNEGYWTKESDTLFTHQCYLEDFVPNNITIKDNDYDSYQKDCLKYRANHFAQVFSNYFNVADTLIWFMNIEIHAGTDEAAKNIYPYKLNTSTDNKWRWRIDDTDTRLDINNQGVCIQKYNIQQGDQKDVNGNVPYGIWPNNSFLMSLLNSRAFHKVKAQVFKDTIQSISELGSGASTKDKILSFYYRHFWEVSADYFGEMGYNKDAEYTYDSAYLIPGSDNIFDAVPPLTQSLGDKKLSDQEFIINRIGFLARKYHIDNDEKSLWSNLELGRGFKGTIQYTIGDADYPARIIQEGPVYSDKRFPAKSEITFQMQASSDANSAICNTGNISKFTITGSNEDTISINGWPKLTELDLSSYNSIYTIENLYNIENLDISNNQHIQSENVKLTNSIHLQSLNAGNTNLQTLHIPSGSSISKLNLPSTCTELYIDSLKNLRSDNITIAGAPLDFKQFTDIYAVNCNENINPLANILKCFQDSHIYNHIYLSGIYEVWNNKIASNNLQLLTELANRGIKGYTQKSQFAQQDDTTKMHISGNIKIQSNYYVNQLQDIKNNIDGNINFEVSDNYFRLLKFKDNTFNNFVLNYIKANGGSQSSNDIVYDEFESLKDRIASYSGHASDLIGSGGNFSDFGIWFPNLQPAFLKGHSLSNLDIYIKYPQAPSSWIHLDNIRPANTAPEGACITKKLLIEGDDLVRIREYSNGGQLLIEDFTIKSKTIQFYGQQSSPGNGQDKFTNVYIDSENVPTFYTNTGINEVSYASPILYRSSNIYIYQYLYWKYVLDSMWGLYLTRSGCNFTPYNFNTNTKVSIPKYSVVQFDSPCRIFSKSYASINSLTDYWLKPNDGTGLAIHFATFTQNGKNRYLYGNTNFNISLNSDNKIQINFIGKDTTNTVNRVITLNTALQSNKEYVILVQSTKSATKAVIMDSMDEVIQNLNDGPNVNWTQSSGYPTATETPILIGAYNSYQHNASDSTTSYQDRISAKGDFIGAIFGIYQYQFDENAGEYKMFNWLKPNEQGFASDSYVDVTIKDSQFSIYQP